MTGEGRAESLEKQGRRGCRAAGGEHIVEHKDMLAGRDGVGVDLDRVGAVFEVVLLGHRGAGKLARLADRNEADVKRVGHGGTEDEASSFDADDGVDSGVTPRIGERLDGRCEPVRVSEQGRDVLKDDPRLRNVGDVADQRGELGEGQSSHHPIVAGSGLLLSAASAADRVERTTVCVSPPLPAARLAPEGR